MMRAEMGLPDRGKLRADTQAEFEAKVAAEVQRLDGSKVRFGQRC